MTKKIIVSDVGGTNGRFGIAEFSNQEQKPKINSFHVFPCTEFTSFADMFGAYLDKVEGEIPKEAILAIAGEVLERSGFMWHHKWQFSSDELEKRFSLKNVKMLNDHAAVAFAVDHFLKDQLITISDKKPIDNNLPYSVFGPGSGFGAAIGVPSSAGLKVVPTEIGHVSYAPKNQFEWELCDYLKDSLGFVSTDRLISGPGIKRIYDFLLFQGHPGDSKLNSHDITKAALDNSDATCRKTVLTFLSMLGSVSGDVALAHGAKGGIYIGGGIVPKLVSLIDESDFMKRFYDKGPMTRFVEIVPIYVISTDKPGLLGAAMAKF
ncbi:MAG: glucokinase [Kordiimonadaceae bacterium]|nr:glucokinase [Kordiimonadaceae bacterium]MBT6033664.1 glucokinase [Kordiimonadaceae bacterium]